MLELGPEHSAHDILFDLARYQVLFVMPRKRPSGAQYPSASAYRGKFLGAFGWDDCCCSAKGAALPTLASPDNLCARLSREGP